MFLRNPIVGRRRLRDLRLPGSSTSGVPKMMDQERSTIARSVFQDESRGPALKKRPELLAESKAKQRRPTRKQPAIIAAPRPRLSAFVR